MILYLHPGLDKDEGASRLHAVAPLSRLPQHDHISEGGQILK